MKNRIFFKTLIYLFLFLLSACTANKETKSSKPYPENETEETGNSEKLNKTNGEEKTVDSTKHNKTVSGKVEPKHLNSQTLSKKNAVKVFVKLKKFRSSYVGKKSKKKNGKTEGALAEFQVVLPKKLEGRIIRIYFPGSNEKKEDKKYKVENFNIEKISFLVPKKFFAENAKTIDDSHVFEFTCNDQLMNTSSFPGLMMARMKHFRDSAPQSIDTDQNEIMAEGLEKNETACNPKIEIFKKSYCSCRRDSDCKRISRQVKFMGGYCRTCGIWPINRRGARKLRSYLSRRRPKRCPKYRCAPYKETVSKCKKGNCILSPVD